MSNPPNFTGRIIVKVKETLPHMPSHVDVAAGLARPLSYVDDGREIDRCINSCCEGVRCRRVFSSRSAAGIPGEQHQEFQDDEIAFGLDRTLAIDLSEPREHAHLVTELRSLASVDWAMSESYSFAPLAETESLSSVVAAAHILKPYKAVKAFEGGELEQGHERIIVAVVDTGIALEHLEFQNRIYGGIDTVDLGIGSVSGDMTLIGDSRGRDFCARDETGHGSHVAGIIGARGLKLPGGLAGRALIAPIRALAAARNSAGRLSGIGGTLDIDAAIKVAVDMGANVLNLSLGTREDDIDPEAPPPHSDVITYAHSRNVVAVAAMGNSGERERFYPAAINGVIAVGSVDSDGQRAPYSSFGDHITLSAPGTDIVSVGLSGYRRSTGTSHAAPFVAGAAALLKARSRALGVTLTPRECRELLMTSATALGEEFDQVGAGLLNVAGAICAFDERYQHEKEEQNVH